jgi:uncharacterized membrane protein
MTTNLAAWERGISVGTGAALLWLATRDSMRGTKGRTGLAATGAGLIARGVSGYCPVTAALQSSGTREALSGPKGIHVRESIMVARPVEAVYAAWRDLSNLPTFMDHVARVDLLEDGRTHWVVRGPSGSTLEWDAEIINDIPNELIAWRSVEGADVVSAGSVRFEPASRGRTEVRVHMQYAPPTGRLGAWVSTLLGADPARQVRDDLRRFKHGLENGSSATTLRAV